MCRGFAGSKRLERFSNREPAVPRTATVGLESAVSPMHIDRHLTPTDLVPAIDRMFELSADKIRSLEGSWPAEAGAPVFTVEGRYQSRAFLDNTSSADRTLPDYYTVDASARVAVRDFTLMVRGVNLGDTQKFGSGAVSGSGRVRYFVLPARAMFVTLGYAF